MRLNNFYYNFRVTIYDENNEKKSDKLYSQLKEIQGDLPNLTAYEIRYLSNNNNPFARRNPKFKGISIQKITPILKI